MTQQVDSSFSFPLLLFCYFPPRQNMYSINTVYAFVAHTTLAQAGPIEVSARASRRSVEACSWFCPAIVGGHGADQQKVLLTVLNGSMSRGRSMYSTCPSLLHCPCAASFAHYANYKNCAADRSFPSLSIPRNHALPPFLASLACLLVSTPVFLLPNYSPLRPTRAQGIPT